MTIDWKNTHAAVWRHNKKTLRSIKDIDPIQLVELINIDRQKKALTENTKRFINKLPANNVLLWGARGTGKSSLIKAVLNEYKKDGLRLIEVFKRDLHHLPDIVDEIRDLPYQFIIYCDDFSFEADDHSYSALKTVLEGSIEARPDNILIYATSNRRHLMPQTMKDNLDSKVIDGELHLSDAIEEKISLSDRFGLWLSFHPISMDEYLQIVDSYFSDYKGNRDELYKAAKDFSISRASRSGRTAKQFFNYFSQSDKS